MAGQFLRVTSGNAAGTEIPLDDELMIGRGAGGDGSLGGDLELSREHAKVAWVGAELVIEDLGSTNGTFVMGVRIEAPTPIKPGDTIKVGASTIEVAGTVPPDQPTAERPIAPPVGSTRVRTSPGAAGAGPGAGAPAPPPAAPPPDAPAAPQAAPGPPPGVGGPPPGVGGPPGMAGPGGPPPAIASRMKRMKRMIILGALGGFLLGFAIATVIWVVL